MPRSMTSGKPAAHRWRFVFEPRDLWFGVFVAKREEELDRFSDDYVQRTYICLFPTLVIVLERWWHGVP